MGTNEEHGERRTSTSYLPVPFLARLLQPRPAPRQLLSKAQSLGMGKGDQGKWKISSPSHWHKLSKESSSVTPIRLGPPPPHSLL